MYFVVCDNDSSSPGTTEETSAVLDRYAAADLLRPILAEFRLHQQHHCWLLLLLMLLLLLLRLLLLWQRKILHCCHHRCHQAGPRSKQGEEQHHNPKFMFDVQFNSSRCSWITTIIHDFFQPF